MIVINDNVPMISLMTSLPMIINNTIAMITINVMPMISWFKCTNDYHQWHIKIFFYQRFVFSTICFTNDLLYQRFVLPMIITWASCTKDSLFTNDHNFFPPTIKNFVTAMIFFWFSNDYTYFPMIFKFSKGVIFGFFNRCMKMHSVGIYAKKPL